MTPADEVSNCAFAIRDCETLDELRRMQKYISGLTLTDADRYQLRIEIANQREIIYRDAQMEFETARQRQEQFP